jgi:hypothetical protein
LAGVRSSKSATALLPSASRDTVPPESRGSVLGVQICDTRARADVDEG